MKNFFLKIIKSPKASFIIPLVCIFCSILFIFPAGLFYSSTSIETTSEYIAEIAGNHTISGKYAAMMVEPNDSTTKTIRDSYDEFLYLYGIFREGLATYAEAVNSEKSHTVKISELNNNTNFSFFHIDRGYGAEPYKDHYKTLTYPLEVMFSNRHPYDPKASFVYVSQSVADKLLDSEGKEHTDENYKNLIHTYITLEIDGKNTVYYIDNIYFETNYFYEALYEVMGDFIVGGAYYPPGVFKKQGLFFLRNYAYQNEYYIEYATSIYPSSDFQYSILERNLKDGFKVDYGKIQFFKNTRYDFLSIFLLVISILLLLFSLSILFFSKSALSLKKHIAVFASLFLPYFIFWIIHKLSNSTILFSSFSTISVLWFMLSFIFLYLVLFIVKYKRSKIK